MGSPFTDHDRSSDEEDEVTPLSIESRGDTDLESEPTKTSAIESNLIEGMLPRDLPKRTAFYDSVEERQISHIEARLFYQHSQTELQAPGLAPETEHLPVPSGSVDPITDSMNELPTTSTTQPFPKLQSLESSTATRPAQESSEDHRQTSGRQSSHDDFCLMDPSATPFGGSSAEADMHFTSEMEAIASDIRKALDMRKKYIQLSLQGPFDNPKDSPDWVVYPPPPEPSWVNGSNSAADSVSNSMVLSPDKELDERSSAQEPVEFEEKKTHKKRRAGEDVGQDFDMDDVTLPSVSATQFKLDDNGIYQVFEESAESGSVPIVQVPSIREFYMDLEEISRMSSDGPGKSFAFRRLQYLEGKFNLYVLLNGYQEVADSKRVPHRDFYNVRKVDTHVHHSACMNQKHLLRFIKSKMKKCWSEVVLFRDGRYLTLKEVFQSINLTAYDLSIDTLDMHVSTVPLPCFIVLSPSFQPSLPVLRLDPRQHGG
jgi:AMP deaminase